MIDLIICSQNHDHIDTSRTELQESMLVSDSVTLAIAFVGLEVKFFTFLARLAKLRAHQAMSAGL